MRLEDPSPILPDLLIFLFDLSLSEGLLGEWATASVERRTLRWLCVRALTRPRSSIVDDDARSRLFLGREHRMPPFRELRVAPAEQ